MKRLFVTLDIEEWTQMEYMKPYGFSEAHPAFCAQLDGFLDFLKEHNLHITTFAVGESAARNARIIRRIHDDGHEVGIHSYAHTRSHEMTNADFEADTLRAKKTVEDIIGAPVVGFRAPCFSMDLDKLDILRKHGFLFDSSYIAFKEHALYYTFDISAFEKLDSIVYRKNGLYEFEIPTLNMLGKQIPISGGGYFRLFPYPLMRAFYHQYGKNEDNFLFYFHPFELSREQIEGWDKIGPKDRFRFGVGRGHNPEKIKRFILKAQSEGTRIDTMRAYIEEIQR